MTRTVRNALAEIIRGALRPSAPHASSTPHAIDALDVLARLLATARPVEASNEVARELGALVSASGDRDRIHVVAAPALAAVRDEARERVRRALDARRRWRRRQAHPAARAGDLSETLRRAAALFDAQLYFEVHEELEIPWRDAGGDTRRVLQGLVQVAVGLHHGEAGNVESMRRLFASGRAKLTPNLPAWHGVDLAALLRGIDAYEAARERHGAARAPRMIVA
jgi:hypothetical protein